MTTVRSILRRLHVSRATAADLVENRDAHYKCYSIAKPGSWKRRHIQEPIGDLKRVQRKLVELLSEYPFHPACKAVTGESIKTNSDPHQDSRYVLKVDISDCYPSTTNKMIVDGMFAGGDFKWFVEGVKALPYCLIENKEGTLVLPTGAPSSPILCNIALTPLDHTLFNLCEEHGYVYTRYIDDMHISTSQPNRDWKIIDQVREAVESMGYKCNVKKSRWYTVNDNDKVIVTGVRIGDKYRVPRQVRKLIRAVLENLARQQLPLDARASGYLAYVKGLDKDMYYSFLQYYQRRLNNAKAYHDGTCASPE